MIALFCFAFSNISSLYASGSARRWFPTATLWWNRAGDELAPRGPLIRIAFTLSQMRRDARESRRIVQRAQELLPFPISWWGATTEWSLGGAAPRLTRSPDPPCRAEESHAGKTSRSGRA